MDQNTVHTQKHIYIYEKLIIYWQILVTILKIRIVIRNFQITSEEEYFLIFVFLRIFLEKEHNATE